MPINYVKAGDFNVVLPEGLYLIEEGSIGLILMCHTHGDLGLYSQEGVNPENIINDAQTHVDEYHKRE